MSTNNDDLNQLVRLAQVLKMRAELLASELAAKHGPLSAKARKASDLACQAERKLIDILDSLNTTS